MVRGSGSTPVLPVVGRGASSSIAPRYPCGCRFAQAINQLPMYPPPETVERKLVLCNKTSLSGHRMEKRDSDCNTPRQTLALRMPPPEKQSADLRAPESSDRCRIFVNF